MNVADEILTWSQLTERPKWMRDALRRIFVNGALDSKDIDELESIIRHSVDLTSEAPHIEAIPLDKPHLRSLANTTKPVTLASVKDAQNANALVPKQTLNFKRNGLTIIYGDNGAGKSGYARILKKACRARGHLGRILPNAYLATPTKDAASATIGFFIGDKEDKVDWVDDKHTDEALSNIAVFDHVAGRAYLQDTNAIYYLPFEIDALVRLAHAADTISNRIIKERHLYSGKSDLTHLTTQKTEVASFINLLSAQTNETDVIKLATLTTEETSKLAKLEAQLREMEATDPNKKASELRLTAQRLTLTMENLVEISTRLALGNCTKLRQLRDDVKEAQRAANVAANHNFSDLPISNIGTTTWKKLWEAAKEFAESEMHPGQNYPKTQEGEVCVLCQTPYDQSAVTRMERFAEFVDNTTRKKADELAKSLDSAVATLMQLPLTNADFGERVKEITVQLPSFGPQVESLIKWSIQRRKKLLIDINGEDWHSTEDVPLSNFDPITQMITSLLESADTLEKNAEPKAMAKLREEIEPLRARNELLRHKDTVIKEIRRLKAHEQIDKALSMLDTRQISLKIGRLTEQIFKSGVKETFENELKELNLRNIKVKLQKTGTRKGEFLHQIVLDTAAKNVAPLPEVGSEGELRCVALAGFLAEAATIPSKSGMIIDDPVSSLDHEKREIVARRLVSEASTRQVIIFTHDLAFLDRLTEFAELDKVDYMVQTLICGGHGPGKCEDRLPWFAQKTRERLSDLRERVEKARKVFEEEGGMAYEDCVRAIYEHLRQTWERAIEEHLLNDAVRRYSRKVQTQRLKAAYKRFSQSEYMEIDRHYSRASNFAHDQPSAGPMALPDPDAMLADIEHLDAWVNKLKKIT